MIYRFLLLAFLLLINTFSFSGIPKKNDPPSSLNVAIYPYLPRTEQFKNILTQAWNSLRTGVQLNFVNYDCYLSDPPDSLDVFVFDGIYYKYFIAQNYLKPIPISSVNDRMGFMNFAWDAVWINSTAVYALPYLGCSNVYFYRKSDPAFDTLSKNGLDAFYALMGNSPSPTVPQPPLRQGLLMDLSGSTTDACLYLMAQMNLNNNYSKNPYLPPANQLDANVLKHLRLFTKMAGIAQATYNDTINQRINWFATGYGRSLVGITENLCSFPQNYLDSVEFRLLPTADTYLPITEEFFVDMAAMNSKVSSDKYPYALMLINLMTSHDVMYYSMVARSPNENPQFLIPARGKVLADLMDVHPLYINMASMLLNYYSQPFLIGQTSRTWLNQTKSAIKQAMLSGTTNQQLKDKMKKNNAVQIDKEGRFNSIKK